MLNWPTPTSRSAETLEIATGSVQAMVAGRILESDNELNSKLANTRWWDITNAMTPVGKSLVLEVGQSPLK